MFVSKGKCYLKRKRFLNEISQEILTTLQRIYFLRNEIISEANIKDQAQKFAEKIEAVCLTPKNKMSNEEYHNILILKTHELCDALKRKMLPNQTSPIAIAANQQLPLQQGCETASADFNNESNKINDQNIDLKNQFPLIQDKKLDIQISPEMLMYSQQMLASASPQIMTKKGKTRKNNVRPNMNSNLNKKNKIQSEDQKSVFELQSNEKQYFYGNDCGYGDQGMVIANDNPSNIGNFANYNGNGMRQDLFQKGGNLQQDQLQKFSFFVNDEDKASGLGYSLNQSVNDSRTIFPVSSKSSTLFPVIEENCPKTDPFNLPDDGFFENSCLKDGIDFDSMMSFSFM